MGAENGPWRGVVMHHVGAGAWEDVGRKTLVRNDSIQEDNEV